MGSPTGILSKDQQILSNNGIAWDSEDEVVLYRRLIINHHITIKIYMLL